MSFQKYFILTFLLSTILLCSSCFRKIENTKLSNVHFNYRPVDYSKTENWAALPNRIDNADLVPSSNFTDNQKNAKVDVFFVHPTLNISKKKWNSEVDNKLVKYIIDNTAIKHQATAFNGSCKIYAPRYRQATIYSYFTTDDKADFAFELAYNDVVTAFLYYMKNYNNGRPFVLASHSQGTSHLMRLLNEFDGSNLLKDKMIVAYLIGMPVEKDFFRDLKVCESENETNCFCSWSTYAYGQEIPEFYNNALITNPLNWQTDVIYAADSLNKGSTFYRFNKVHPKTCDAQIRDGVLWVRKPKHWISNFMEIKNLHIADYNLFWVNLRENVAKRVDAFLEEKNQ